MKNADIRKKILYKAKYRGTREGDTLLRGFSAYFIANASESELYTFADFLELTDQNILYMVRYNICPYTEFQGILDKLITYQATQ